jgi:hypothetical protein
MITKVTTTFDNKEGEICIEKYSRFSSFIRDMFEEDYTTNDIDNNIENLPLQISKSSLDLINQWIEYYYNIKDLPLYNKPLKQRILHYSDGFTQWDIEFLENITFGTLKQLLIDVDFLGMDNLVHFCSAVIGMYLKNHSDTKEDFWYFYENGIIPRDVTYNHFNVEILDNMLVMEVIDWKRHSRYQKFKKMFQSIGYE